MYSDLIEVSHEVRASVEETSVVTRSVRNSRQHWAVVLAGGDGKRLQRVTLKIAGDSRPKQFCSIFGEERLLTQTRARLDPLFHVDRELFAALSKRQGRVVTGEQVAKALLEAVLTAKTGTHIIESENLRIV